MKKGRTPHLIRFPPDLHEALKKLAAQENISFNRMVTTMCRAMLEEQRTGLWKLHQTPLFTFDQTQPTHQDQTQ